MTSPRISMPPVETMDAIQKRIHDDTLRSLGGPYGPRMVLMNHPALADKWCELAEVLNAASFPSAIRELVVLMVASHWRADFEWYAHEPQAVKAGLPPSTIDAIHAGRRPVFDDGMQAAVYDYVDALQTRHVVDDPVYAAAREALGDRGLIELTVLLGHYTNVAMTLIAHRVPLPEGVASPFATTR